MAQNSERKNRRVVLRATTTKVRTSQLLAQSGVRAIEYPFATAFGALASYGASLGVTQIPVTTASHVFLKAGAGFSLGTFILMLLVAFGALRDSEFPNLRRVLTTSLAISIPVGLIAAAPATLVFALLPDVLLSSAKATWMYSWGNQIVVSIGGLWLLSAPGVPIAWSIAARHELPLGATLQFIWDQVESRRYQPFQVSVASGFVAGALALLPGLCFLAIPYAFHVVASLADSLVERRNSD